MVVDYHTGSTEYRAIAKDKYVANGVRSWPENPFTALSKLPPDYDADLYVLSQMKDRDWIFTGDGNNTAYNNTIAHLRKSDSVSTWTYDKLTGEIDYNGTPFGRTEHFFTMSCTHLDSSNAI